MPSTSKRSPNIVLLHIFGTCMLLLESVVVNGFPELSTSIFVRISLLTSEALKCVFLTTTMRFSR